MAPEAGRRPSIWRRREPRQGRTRGTVNQPHFAEALAGSKKGQNHLVAFGIPIQDFRTATHNDEQRIGFVTRADDRRIARYLAANRHFFQLFELGPG